MGSLPASGIPIATKTNTTYRKRDILITCEDSRDDSVANLVTTAPVRTISSGSIVRDDGVTSTVEYHEDLVWGVTRMARTCRERIASDESCARETIVDLNGNETLAVIEDSLKPHTPQLGHRHTGNNIVEGQAVGDVVVERIPNSGVYDG
jgi:hypothetical protein